MTLMFADESKSKGYTVVAAVVAATDAAALRRDLRALVLPGQRRIHFTHESPDRRKMLLSRFEQLGVRAQVFHSAATSEVSGREACLAGVVDHAASHGCSRIVLERDESIERADRRTLFREVARHGLTDSLQYDLLAPQAEPLLWPADAIAWAFTKGGDWRRRIDPMLLGVTTVAGKA